MGFHSVSTTNVEPERDNRCHDREWDCRVVGRLWAAAAGFLSRPPGSTTKVERFSSGGFWLGGIRGAGELKSSSGSSSNEVMQLVLVNNRNLELFCGDSL